MDATCTIQDSIHVFSLVHKYVSRILGTYHIRVEDSMYKCICDYARKHKMTVTEVVLQGLEKVLNRPE